MVRRASTLASTPDRPSLPGQSQTYKFYAESVSIEAAQFSDFGGDATGKIGLYGALSCTRRTPGSPTRQRRPRHYGAVVDTHVPGKPGYRDNTLFLQDDDPQIGSDFMPYPIKVGGLTLINYKNAGRRTDDFSGTVATPLLQAYVGDPSNPRLSTPGSEQPHVFRAGGLSWLRDPYMPGSQEVAEQGLSPFQARRAHHRRCRWSWITDRRLLLRRQPASVHRGRHVGRLPGAPEADMHGDRAAPAARGRGLQLIRREPTTPAAR